MSNRSIFASSSSSSSSSSSREFSSFSSSSSSLKSSAFPRSVRARFLARVASSIVSFDLIVSIIASSSVSFAFAPFKAPLSSSSSMPLGSTVVRFFSFSFDFNFNFSSRMASRTRKSTSFLFPPSLVVSVTS